MPDKEDKDPGKNSDDKRKKVASVWYDITVGLGANMLSIPFLLGGEFLFPKNTLWAVITSGLLYAVFWVLSGLVVAYVHNSYDDRIKRIWHYFPLTAPIAVILEQRRQIRELREELAEKNKRLKDLQLSTSQETRLVAMLTDPQERAGALKLLSERVAYMSDQELVSAIDGVRRHLAAIAVPAAQEYQQLKLILGKLSSLPPARYPHAWHYFLGVLTDVFDGDSTLAASMDVRRDMVATLTEAALRVDRAHLASMQTVVEKIMGDPSPDHYLASSVLHVVLQDGCQKHMRQRVFDEAKKRAFKYPRDFGFELLKALYKLEEKTFWLDIDSLQHVWVNPENHGRNGIIPNNDGLYTDLCKGVFCPLEDPRHPSIVRGRVYRRLESGFGKVDVCCTLTSGKKCSCKGKSLSFRGLFSEQCAEQPSTRLSLTLATTGNGGLRLELVGSIAPLHTNENGDPVSGRGILFEDGNDKAIRQLYDYIRQHV